MNAAALEPGQPPPRPTRAMTEDDRAYFTACFRGLGSRGVAAFVALAAEVERLEPASPVLAWALRPDR